MKWVTLFFVLAANSSQAQKAALTFTEVVQVDSASQTQLFERARQWFNDAFKDSGEVLNIQDKESGELAGRGSFEYNSNANYRGSIATKGSVTFTIRVLVKDGRYKYEITKFIHEGNPLADYGAIDMGLITEDEACPYAKEQVGSWSTPSWRDKVWSDIRTQIDSQVIPVISSLKKGMEQTSNTDSDW